MKRTTLSERALILAPRGRDASIAAAILREAGLTAEVCPSLPDIIVQLDAGAAFVVVTEEALATADLAPLAIWLNDQAPRPPRALADGEVLDLGGRRVRRIDTPHVPHCWDAGLMFEETTRTLFCSDLFTHVGDPRPLTDGDILEPAMAAESAFGFTGVTPATGPTIRRLAALKPRTLAVMHGSSFTGDGAEPLERLAAFYEERLAKGPAPRG